jgi:hypothetical protein
VKLGETDRALGCVAVVFTVLVAGAAPSVDWLDSGSLLSSAARLGVAHPPGEPGWLAPARLAQLVPIGDLAFRVNILAALCLAVCAWPLLVLTRAVTGPRDGGPGPEVFAVGLGLLGYGARMQGNRAEVYSLVALLLLGSLAMAIGQQGRRASAGMGLLLGLAATVHPLLAAAATPALLLARGLRGPVDWRDAAHAVGWGLVGFAAYAWLPVRARIRPADAWGVPADLSRFVDVLLARNFARNFGGDGGSWTGNMAVVLERHALSGLGVVLLLAIGAWMLLRGREDRIAPRRALAWAAPLWIAGNAATILPQNKVFGTNPDVLGYLLVGALGVVPLGALGVAALQRHRVGTSLERLGPALLAVAWLFVGLQLVDGHSSSRSQSDLARRFATAQAAELPAGAVLLVSGNDTAFVWRYLQGVERRRPDLLVVPRVLLGHPHERLRLQEPLAAIGIPWTPALRDAPVGLLLGAARPAFIEVRRPELGAGLVPHGLVGKIGSGSETESLAAVRTSTLKALDEARGDTEATLVAALFRAMQEEL